MPSQCSVSRKNCSRNVANDFRAINSTLSKTNVSLIIFIICVCGRIAIANARISGTTLWDSNQLTEHSGDVMKFQNLPSFGKVPDSIEVLAGQTAVLSCIVNNLGNRMVSWIRTSDLQILTSGSITFTGDNRFSAEPADDILSNCWGLMIRNVRYIDRGSYECQVNTEPKLKINVTLIVREPQLMDHPFYGTTIDGPRIHEIKSGGTLGLTCRATISASSDDANRNKKGRLFPSNRVTWILNNTPLSSQILRGGINIYTELGVSEVVSNLTLTKVTNSDEGIYQCSIDGMGTDEITLYVMNDPKNNGYDAIHSSNAMHIFLLLYIVHSTVNVKDISLFCLIYVYEAVTFLAKLKTKFI